MNIEIKRDYDGYFERLVKNWIARKKGEFKHDVVVINAAPWREAAVTYHSQDKVLTLYFYSPLRNGFGELTEQDQKELVELL